MDKLCVKRYPMISIGMAVVDDFRGPRYTIQSLRMTQDLSDCEILIVDNNPKSPESEDLKDYVKWVTDVPIRYIPYDKIKGTAAPRNLIFEEAKNPYVLCMDSHVTLWKDSISKLKEFYLKNPYTSDLIQGPMLYDDLFNPSTHFSDYWEMLMWGKWESSWKCTCGNVLSLDKCTSDIHVDEHIQERELCPKCNKKGFYFHNVTNKQNLERGFIPMNRDMLLEEKEPFEIPAMGLGLFSCRKDSWLKFNPRMTDFGGEEWYIHLKYKQKGNKVLCLPGLLWNHEFRSKSGLKLKGTPIYPRVRNYVLGLHELQIPLDRCYYHFVRQHSFPQDKWDEIVLEVTGGKIEIKDEPIKKKGCCGSQTVVHGDPPQGFERRERKDNRTAIEKAHARNLESHEGLAEFSEELEGYEITGLLEITDIRGPFHVACLKRVPSVHVTCSSSDTDVSMDKRITPLVNTTIYIYKEITSINHGTNTYDFVYINKKLQADDLYNLTMSLKDKCKGKIVFGGTLLRGEMFEEGDPSKGPGILPVVRRFIKENKEWKVKKHIRKGEGYIVVSCRAEDKKPLPSLAEGIWNAALSSMRERRLVMLQKGDVPDQVADERLSHCYLCESLRDGICAECRCPVELKVTHKKQFCPLFHWDQYKE